MYGTEAAINRGTGGFQVENSIWVHSDNNTWLTKTFAQEGLGYRDKFTFSIWLKRLRTEIDDGEDATMMVAGTTQFNSTRLFLNDDQMSASGRRNNDFNYSGRTSPGHYRNVNDWQHFLFVMDQANSNSNLQSFYYIDGVLVVQGSLNEENGFFMDNREHALFRNHAELNNNRMSGYVAEVACIDGQILGPENFGEWNKSAPDVWQPRDLLDGHIDWSGTNSFYLNFADPNDLGKDVSGRANSFSRNNINSSNHSTDTPTNNCGLMSTINDINAVKLSNGNRRCQRTSTTNNAFGNFAMAQGKKWYFECLVEDVPVRIGIQGLSLVNDDEYSLQTSSGNIHNDDGSSYTYSTAILSGGTILGVAVDLVNYTIEFYYNNVGQGTYPIIQTDYYARFRGDGNGGIGDFRFNEGEFTYTPPADHLPLMAKSLVPAVTDSKKYFDPVTYVGTGVSNFIQTKNKVDLVISKQIFNATYWPVNDSVRGAGNIVFTNVEDAELVSDSVQSFDPVAGYTVGTANSINESGRNLIGYPFTKDPVAGMDIQLFTGDGIAGKTVPHNLGVKPELMLLKNRDSTNNWQVYFEPLGATQYLILSTNGAANTTSTRWNDTEPDASVFTVGTNAGVNGAGERILAYLFASIAGFSKVFQYTGNGLAAGPFVNCGFKPAFILIKQTNATRDWIVADIVQNDYNPAHDWLLPNDTQAVWTSGPDTDFLSNGFKIRDTNSQSNGSGNNYVGIAFAENPFGMRGR